MPRHPHDAAAPRPPGLRLSRGSLSATLAPRAGPALAAMGPDAEDRDPAQTRCRIVHDAGRVPREGPSRCRPRNGENADGLLPPSERTPRRPGMAEAARP